MSAPRATPLTVLLISLRGRALSTPGTEADTYLKLFEHNATAIAGALEARR